MATTTDATPAALQRADQAGLRILVPLDETRQARRALEYAEALVIATRGVLMLVRASGVEDQAGYLRLSHMAERLRETKGIAVESTVVANEDAVSAILETAHTWKPDLIAMATRKTSALDRWLNGSVTDELIRSAEVPVLIVPPDWDRLLEREQPVRILVPLDGSQLAEQALIVALRLADIFTTHLILLRAIPRDDPGGQGAREYVRRIGVKAESALSGGEVTTRVVSGGPVEAILNAARDFDVAAIVMSTHGHAGLERAVLGSTATSTVEHARVPLIVLGPRALLAATTAQIHVGARVRTVEQEMVGSVHRVVVDLAQRAIVSVVVLGQGPLARDVLVPVDFIETVDPDQVYLRITRDELDQLPDFSYSEFVTPPPTWTLLVPRIIGPTWMPSSQRKRMGPRQQDITRGSRVQAVDGDVGTIDSVEVDTSGQLDAFWVRANGIFATDMRIPVEWVKRADVQGNLFVDATRADIESYLGHESRARLAR